jgi:hypothetical protein
MLLRAMLRAGVPMQEVLDIILNQPIIQVDRNDAELLLLDFLFYTIREDSGHVHIEGQPAEVRSRLRPIVQRYLDQMDNESCLWAMIALHYDITDAKFEETFNKMDYTVSELWRAYSVRRLLPDTLGFVESSPAEPALAEKGSDVKTRAPRSAQPSAGDDDGSAERPLKAGQRLWAELHGDRATRYVSYRWSVADALVLLLRSPYKAEVRPWLAPRIQEVLDDEHTPFHVRRTLWNIRTLLHD